MDPFAAPPPNLISETTLALPTQLASGLIFENSILIPDNPCVRYWVEVESQDVSVTWLASPWGESALLGRRSAVSATIENFRWSADTGPAGSKARFPLIQGRRGMVPVVTQIQNLHNLSVDPYNGVQLQGTTARPRLVIRVWDGDPIWYEYAAPNPTVFSGPSGFVILAQTPASGTTVFGHPPGYSRWFAGYANNGCQWQIGSPDNAFLVANVVNQRVSSGIHPACDVRLFNGGGAATQGSLTWSTQPIAI